MTIKLFIILFAIETIVSTLLTEAIKKTYQNMNKNYSANLIALVNAFVVGGLGTVAFYNFYLIPFTVSNIIVLIIAIFAVWMGSTLSYDKILQSIKQIQALISL